MSVSSLNRLRNKLGVTLNLKHPAARDVFRDLARRSDVLVENFSRGVLDRLGVGYAFVHEVNPKLVYLLDQRLRLDGRRRRRQGDGHDHPGAERRHVHIGTGR